jgi:hypothetical protein
VSKSVYVPGQKAGVPSQLLGNLFQNAGIEINQEESKQNWDYLREIYEAHAQFLVAIATQINACIRLVNQSEEQGTPELRLTINTFTNDLHVFTEQLLSIKQRHEGLTGVVKDGDELSHCLSIYNDYVIWEERVRAISFPIMLTVTEYMGEWTNKIQEREKADVNVITDVEAKEINPKMGRGQTPAIFHIDEAGFIATETVTEEKGNADE